MRSRAVAACPSCPSFIPACLSHPPAPPQAGGGEDAAAAAPPGGEPSGEAANGEAPMATDAAAAPVRAVRRAHLPQCRPAGDWAACAPMRSPVRTLSRFPLLPPFPQATKATKKKVKKHPVPVASHTAALSPDQVGAGPWGRLGCSHRSARRGALQLRRGAAPQLRCLPGTLHLV